MRVDRVVVTGGAGFIGSHLCEALLRDGCDVVCLDNFLTGTPTNVAGLIAHPRFRLRFCDLTQEIRLDGPVDAVLHLASASSPADRRQLAVRSLRTGAVGTWRALELARAKGARLVLGSSAEVYGEPQIHPQPEHYWGAVDPVGPTSAYSEGQRYAEALTAVYRAQERTDTAIVRIFGTFGPRMRLTDGRAVGTFLRQALRAEPLTVTGDGGQIRSACYVDDLVEGFLRVARSSLPGPINLGEPQGRSVLRTARDVLTATGSTAPVRFVDARVDEPGRRCPDVTLAGQLLDWRPRTPWPEGLATTVSWARRQLGPAGIMDGHALQRLPKARLTVDR
jgi:dTDP-glucose 4,6-dehydratase